MIVLDEHRLQWDVKQGDPAYAAVNYLLKAGFKNIVLPMTILFYGRRTDDLPWPTIEGLRKRVGKDFLHYANLFDQATALDESEHFR